MESLNIYLVFKDVVTEYHIIAKSFERATELAINKGLAKSPKDVSLLDVTLPYVITHRSHGFDLRDFNEGILIKEIIDNICVWEII